MTQEEKLLLTLQKLLSQVYEDSEFIKELCINAITEYGYDRYDEGYGIGVTVGAAGCT